MSRIGERSARLWSKESPEQATSRGAGERLPKGVVLGHMLNHWGVNIPFQIGQGRIEAHAMGASAQAKFLNSLGEWKGDVVFVEKTDRDAGVKMTETPTQDWSWDSTNYAKYFAWTRILSAKSGLRVVGWQVSEGSSTHPVVAHRDDASEYFLAHPRQWVDAGFICILFGPGLSGNANYGSDDDGGWFLQKMTAYNKQPFPLSSLASISNVGVVGGIRVSAVAGGVRLDGFPGIAKVRFIDGGGKPLMTASVTSGQVLPRSSLLARIETAAGGGCFAILP